MRLSGLLLILIMTIAVFSADAEMPIVPTLQSLGASDVFVPATSTEVAQAFAAEAFEKVWTARGDVGAESTVSKYSSVGTSPSTRVFLDRAEKMAGGKGANAVAQALRYLRLKSISRVRARGQAIGRYAELRLVETEGWTQVANPNAPMRDLHRMENGQRVYAQVKVSRLGSEYYIAEMQRDDSSKRFMVPDDHVAGLKDEIAMRAAKAKTPTESAFWQRQKRRVAPIGVDYAKLLAEMDAEVATAERSLLSARLGWVQGGVITLVFIGYDARQASTGAITWTEFGYRAAQHGASVATATGAGVLAALKFPNRPVLVGSATAVAALAVEEVFLTMRYRSFADAMKRPSFWFLTARNATVLAAATTGTLMGAEAGAVAGAYLGPPGAMWGSAIGGFLGGGGFAICAACGFDWVAETLTREQRHDAISDNMDRNLTRLSAETGASNPR